ncbi:hypothetical protein BKA69DRAFT_724486 [Paraphysoderma sedebokerense]|nr:hypothetical protein BKA69DRAFT_724486 [Paraphysoderma sedebokerense]
MSYFYRLNDIPRLSLSDYTFYRRLVSVLSTASASSTIIHQTELANELVDGFLRIFEDNMYSAELTFLDYQDFEIFKCLTKMLTLFFTSTSLYSYMDAEEDHLTERKDSASLMNFIRQLLNGSDHNEPIQCEEMHCLVLRLIIAWCSNIDSLVLLHSHFHEIQSFANDYDLDDAVIDEISLLKYRFRIGCLILGGPTEKKVQPLPLGDESLQNYIPEDASSDQSQVPFPYLESSSPVTVDLGTSLEQLKVIAQKIILSVDAKLSLPNLKDLLNAIISYLPVRQSAICTTPSVNDISAHFTPLVHQLKNQQLTDQTLPHSFDLPIRLLSEYASRLHSSISTSTHMSNLNNIFKSLQYKKWHRYNAIIPRSTETKKSDKPIPFDWVVGLIYLITINVPSTLDILENLARSKTSLWFWWLLHDDLINHENQGIHLDFEIPFRFHVITQMVEVLLEKENPCLYNSFTMSGMVIGQVTIPLLQTIFTTALNFPQRVHFLLLVLTHGPKYIVYYLVSFLSFYKTEMIKSCTNEMLPWELCNITGGYHSKLYQLGEHWDYLKMLDKQYCVLVETIITKIDGTA